MVIQELFDNAVEAVRPLGGIGSARAQDLRAQHRVEASGRRPG
jgi:hypothetical protein